ncbi:uncharacterized protein MYCFIDRAFT_173243 [Pseudocercospora fijiensis CIRAD86]|uniref:Uncharacterized protein n=1 Tax=Pseudocercospora fijiensis (strain CIRAD86) TaxID=383855 RepID=M3B4E2_PSEFD|nr:uncharacterized protein MYCFIDRAFT_173243 [Pseudocercospora fijiensis CIRAD86]EME84212.1 hypothetical protein MYCFIDRAFT_173243 [Pseudocercospora fijiensis CIRAD86]
MRQVSEAFQPLTIPLSYIRSYGILDTQSQSATHTCAIHYPTPPKGYSFTVMQSFIPRPSMGMATRIGNWPGKSWYGAELSPISQSLAMDLTNNTHMWVEFGDMYEKASEILGHQSGPSQSSHRLWQLTSTLNNVVKVSEERDDKILLSWSQMAMLKGGQHSRLDRDHDHRLRHAATRLHQAASWAFFRTAASGRMHLIFVRIMVCRQGMKTWRRVKVLKSCKCL